MAGRAGPDESEPTATARGDQPESPATVPDGPRTVSGPHIESGEVADPVGIPSPGMSEELAADSNNEPPVLPDPFGIKPFVSDPVVMDPIGADPAGVEPGSEIGYTPMEARIAARAPVRPVPETDTPDEIPPVRINPFRGEKRVIKPGMEAMIAEPAARPPELPEESPPLFARPMTMPEVPTFEPASRDPLPTPSEMQPLLAEPHALMVEPEPAVAEPRPAMLESRPPAAESPPAADPPVTAADVHPAVEHEADVPAITENDGDGFATVKVYYGTDRAVAADVSRFSTSLYATLFAIGATMILVAVAYRFWRTRFARLLAIGGVVATIALVAATANFGLKEGVFSGRKESSMLSYGGERGKLDMGICKVSIPKDHQVGELEAPSILRLEFTERPDEHVTLMSVVPLPTEEFYTDLQKCVSGSCCRSAFVFIHGYNVKFKDAVRRTAQIAYDLKFDGAPICYSWPSQGALTGYTVDETNVAWTVPHLREFLMGIARQSGAEQVHLIAHSMGNRALTSALRDLSFEPDESRPEFQEVVLTAPDIDAEVFRQDIAPAIVKTARRVTLYASSNDRALLSSKKVHGYPRAGDSGANLVVVPGVDTIDVSAIDSSLFGLGHSYYGTNDTVLADLFDLLHEAKPPALRERLIPERLGQLQYWRFRQL